MHVTVELPVDALRSLEAEAARRKVSIGDVIAALANQLPDVDPPTRHRLSFVGIGASGDTRPIDARRERAELAEGRSAMDS